MKCNLTFEPDNISIRVDKGTNLLEGALAAGVHINATCGGQGVCGKCRVVLKSGDVESQKTGQISAAKYADGWRQACRTTVLSDCVVHIPPESRGFKHLGARHLDMGQAERTISGLEAKPLAEGWQLDPVAMKLPLSLTPPTLQDNVSDLSRFCSGLRQQHGIKDVSLDMRCLRPLPKALRGGDWSVTATLMAAPMPNNASSQDKRPQVLKLVRVEEGDTSDRNLAIGLDVGTTTICAELIDLKTGRVLGERATYNGQIRHGEDVITRIVYAQKGEGRKTLQSLVVASINEVIDALVEEAGISRRSISCVVAAGNTTMTHLLLEMETRHIREAPYVPVVNALPLVSVNEIGIALPDCVQAYVFPSVASYVGGDIISGILGSGVFQKKALTLYMDIGTNGEIVLGNADWLTCAACSMGPAFEGGGIKHGMRADRGAIEGFKIDPITLEPMLITVDRSTPMGICGSGLISIVAELLCGGIIDPRGKFVRDLPSDRLREGRFGYEYILVRGEASGTGDDIVITEVDLENLIRAKAALHAGCHTLLASLDLTFDDLDRVMIAGAFGRYINIEKGKQIGLFPDIPVEKFQFVGNGSLLGAHLACLSRDMLAEVDPIAKMMTNIELSENPAFMDNYLGALFLPHTEAGLFPHVSEYLQANWEMVRGERKARGYTS